MRDSSEASSLKGPASLGRIGEPERRRRRRQRQVERAVPADGGDDDPEQVEALVGLVTARLCEMAIWNMS